MDIIVKTADVLREPSDLAMLAGFEDIAGTAWADRPGKPYDAQGGTGVGVRLLTEFLRHYQQ